MEYNVTYREKDKGIQFIVSYKNQSGEWKQKSKQGFTKKRDAKAAAEKMVEELKKTLQIKLNPDLQGLTFSMFRDMFLEHQSLYNEPKTIVNYKVTFKKLALLNDMEMGEISTLYIQKCVDEMIKDGLKLSTIKRNTSNAKMFFSTATEHYRIISENPVYGIRLPEKKTSDKGKIKALTRAELDKLLENINGINEYIITLIAAKCGLRIGEILGITWNDIDFISGTLRVNKQWKFLKDRKWGFGSLKTKNSERTVPVPDTALKELKQYKKQSPASIDGRVIPYINTASTGARLKELYKKHGLDISVHTLRHTYATMLIAAGIDFKTAATILGHDVEQTIKTYSHVTDDMTARATKLIEAIFN